MGWLGSSHLDSTTWSSSYLVLVSGALIGVRFVAPLLIHTFLLATGPRFYDWMHFRSKSQHICR